MDKLISLIFDKNLPSVEDIFKKYPSRGLNNGEKITIYGDYDADGITATTIMTETLSILGADVHYFIPDRFKDGYGPNLARYQDIVADGTRLIITVDNGVTGVEEVKYAQEHNVDVIITDHHTFHVALVLILKVYLSS